MTQSFIVQFSLADVPRRQMAIVDAGAEMVRQQLLNILDVAVLQTDQGPVEVTGFKLIGDDCTYSLYKQ